MSKGELVYNLLLLESLCQQEESALIEADKLEFLNSEGEWVSFKTLDLNYIPILIKAVKQNNDQQEIIYELSYRPLLPIEGVEITPAKKERIIISQDNTKIETYKRIYSTLKNEQYSIDPNIRYNNKGTNTFSKLKTIEELSIFVKSNRRKLQDAVKAYYSINAKPKKLVLK